MNKTTDKVSIKTGKERNDIEPSALTRKERQRHVVIKANNDL